MKAVRIHEHGEVDVLRIDEIDKPSVGPDEILIQVKTAALNHLDLWVRSGIPGVTFPLIMGSDAAGIVVDANGSAEFKTGDEVVIAPIRFCGECPACKSSMDNLCRDFRIPGENYQGVMAEFLTVPEKYVLPKPAQLTWEETAAFPLASITAYHMLKNKVDIQVGHWALIYGASSGVGSAAIQIAKSMGAMVITTASSEEKSKLAVQIGADHVINYKKQSIAKTVHEITAGQGVDVVFEHTGQKTWNDSLRTLKYSGKLVTCGATTGPLVKIDLRALFIKHQQIIGSTMGTLQNLKDIIELINKGRFRPIVDLVYPVEEIRLAHQRLEDGRQFGKIVIRF